MKGLAALDSLRGRKSSTEWSRPPFSPVIDGPVLAFDQSLTATGWAYMSSEFPYVIEQGVLRSIPGDEKGIEGSLVRATGLERRVSKLISKFKEDGLVIAHESPAVFGYRVDASLLMALAIRISASRESLPVHMSFAQRSKKRMTGDANASKSEVKIGLESMWPHLASTKPWNSDVRDAILVGLSALEEGAPNGQ